MNIAPVPPGFLRHPSSGCIIPEAELDMHETALAIKAAHRSIAARSQADVSADTNAANAALAQVAKDSVALANELKAELAALKAERAAAVAPVVG